VLTWLAAFFGPALTVTSFASCQIPDKGIPVETMAPDFTVGCIQYADGVVARVTCGLVAPRDKSITVIGDDGILTVNDVRNDSGPVLVQRIPSTGLLLHTERCLNSVRTWLDSVLPVVPWSGNEWRFQRKYPFARKPSAAIAGATKRVDFFRGPAELSAAVRENRPCRLSADLGCHILELVEALQFPGESGGPRKIQSTFDPIEPLPWEGSSLHFA
jgi:predicted dehydrogenase